MAPMMNWGPVLDSTSSVMNMVSGVSSSNTDQVQNVFQQFM